MELKMRNGKEFKEILRVTHSLEFDEFCQIFGYHLNKTLHRISYAADKYELMKRSLTSYVCQLDEDNLEKFFNYLQEQVNSTSVNLINKIGG